MHLVWDLVQLSVAAKALSLLEIFKSRAGHFLLGCRGPRHIWSREAGHLSLLLVAHPFHVPCRHIKLLRVVIREDLSMSMVEELIKDFVRVVEYLDHHFSFTDDQVGHCSFAVNA